MENNSTGGETRLPFSDDRDFLRCRVCGTDRGGVIDLVAEGKKAPLRCFACHAKAFPGQLQKRA